MEPPCPEIENLLVFFQKKTFFYILGNGTFCNLGQYIWHKVNKSNKTGQDFKNL